jgi:hypothetical protein
MGPVSGTASQAAAREASLRGALRRHWDDRKYGASELTSPHAKVFLRKLSASWARVLKKPLQPCHRPKKLKEYPFEGAPNCWPARGAGTDELFDV